MQHKSLASLANSSCVNSVNLLSLKTTILWRTSTPLKTPSVLLWPYLIRVQDVQLKWQQQMNLFESHFHSLVLPAFHICAPRSHHKPFMLCLFTTCQRRQLWKSFHHLSTTSETDRPVASLQGNSARHEGKFSSFVLLSAVESLGGCRAGDSSTDQSMATVRFQLCIWTMKPGGPSLRLASWVCHASKQIAFYVSRVTGCHNSLVCTLQAVEWKAIANTRST